MDTVLIVLIIMLYKAFIWGGTAYLVFCKGISGWWFFLAALIATIDYSKEKKKEQLTTINKVITIIKK